MIIFDTNALNGLNPRSPKFDLLRALKHAGTQASVPWMVREELVARHVLEYRAAYAAADNSLSSLRRKAPWRTFPFLSGEESEKAINYWRSRYEEVLDTLETSGENALRALAREAYCQKPAKTDPKVKGGARDAAIWLSVIDYLRENPDEPVYFVSANIRDFSDGSSFPPLMLDDLGDMKDRLTILTSFEDVISRFTEEIQIDARKIQDLLGGLSDDSLSAIESSAQATMTNGRFEGTRFGSIGTFEPCSWENWVFAPTAAVHGVSSASGHKIGNKEWYTSTVEWILVGYAQPGGNLYLRSSNMYGGDFPSEMYGTSLVACEWRTKVLFSPGSEGELTIVEATPPRALRSDDRTELLPLINRSAAIQEEELSTVMDALNNIFRASDNFDSPLSISDFNINIGDINPG